MKVERLLNNPLFPQCPPNCGWNYGDEDWNKAELKFLYVFPSNIQAKVISDTQSTLYNIIKKNFGDRVFVDISFMPPKYIQQTYYKTVPYIVGTFSQRTWEDFDILGSSICIVKEEFTQLYWLLSRAGFPLYSEHRMDDGKTPLLTVGGVGIDSSVGFDRIADILSFGYAERWVPKLCELAFQNSPVSKNKSRIVAGMDSLPGSYIPSKFHYGWEIVNGHVESEWLNPEVGMCIPDVSIPIEKYGEIRDTQHFWPLPGNNRKVSLLSAYGCSSGRGTCFFCAEGNLYGSWQERSRESIDRGLREAKASSMAESLSFFSLNANNDSFYVHNLSNIHTYFDKIQSINFRADSLASSIRMGGENNYLRLLKELGSISVAVAMEGLGERIRNKIYNKNLSREDIMVVDREAFKLRFLRLKHGLVQCGFETKEDLKDAFSEFQEIADMRDEMGANSLMQLSITPLINAVGTALYYWPRVMSFANWRETYDENYYYYPFFPLVDMGYKVKTTTRKAETFVQQLLSDLPAELIEDIIFKPSLESKIWSPNYIKGVHDTFLAKGLDPKKQFLELDTFKLPHQHVRVSYADKSYQAMRKANKLEPEFMCLRTLTAIEQNRDLKCKGCGSCVDVDNCRKEHGLSITQPYSKWITTRNIDRDFDLMEVRSTKIVNEPAFTYAVLFVFDDATQYMGKEFLIRQWLVKAAKKNPDWVTNFRKISYSFWGRLDYKQLTSIYSGYEINYFSFKNKLDEHDTEECIKYANENSFGVKCIRWEEQQLAGGKNYWILVEIKLNCDLIEANKAYRTLTHGKFMIYDTDPAFPRPKGGYPSSYYLKFKKTTDGYSIFVLCKPLANPVYTFLLKFELNRIFKIVKSQRVIAVLSQIEKDVFMNYRDNTPFTLNGFTWIKSFKKEVDIVEEEHGPDVEGA